MYVGQTIRHLRIRIGEHQHFIEYGSDKRSVPLHFATTHNKLPAGLQVSSIEYISDHFSPAEQRCRHNARETRDILDLEVEHSSAWWILRRVRDQ